MKPHKLISFVLLCMMLFVFIGCGAGYRTKRVNGVETVYYVDEEGRQRIIYVVNKDGSVTAHDENDPMFKRYMAAKAMDRRIQAHMQAQAEKKEMARQARIAAIRQAKKRRPYDPIYVTVRRPVMKIEERDQLARAKKAKSMAKTEDQVHQYVKDALSDDRVLRLSSRKADVEVLCDLAMEGMLFHNRKKPGQIKADYGFVCKLTARSNYLPEDVYEVEERGHWMQNQRVVERAVRRLNHMIKKRIGPNIPKERRKYL